MDMDDKKENAMTEKTIPYYVALPQVCAHCANHAIHDVGAGFTGDTGIGFRLA